MKYLYFPGCSLKGTGKAYDESLRAVFAALDIELSELEDWNCCGATAYANIDETKSHVLAARNLAIAEKQDLQLIAPCSACYLVLNKTQHALREQEQTRRVVKEALAAAGLQYKDSVTIRHPLDVLINDVGFDKLAKRVKAPLKGRKFAAYYGCQIVRPYATFDDQYNPTSMEKLLKTAGAECVEYPLKTRCCGGSLTGTLPEVGLRLSYILLKEARRRGAEALVTVCPLCQFNLDAYQDKMEEQFDMPILYFTQVLGLAFGLDPRELGIKRGIVSAEAMLAGGR